MLVDYEELSAFEPDVPCSSTFIDTGTPVGSLSGPHRILFGRKNPIPQRNLLQRVGRFDVSKIC